MGMFNIIDLKRGCPSCGAKVEWQTKGLVIDNMYPVENVLKTFSLNKRLSGEIHSLCRKCGTWIEAKLINGRLIDLKTEKQRE